MESNLLTAEDVAKQLRIKKYTVYELIKRGELPSSKVGKQVRISQTDIDRYLESNKTGPQYSERLRENSRELVDLISSGRPNPPEESPDLFSSTVIISGQDMCLDLLVTRLSGAGSTVLRSYVGCYNGLYSLYHGRVTMSATHLWDAETDTYNYPFIRRLLPGLPVGVFRLGGRMQGLYVRKGNPMNIRGWEDFSRPELSMINRERGSGTRILLDQKLAQLKINTTAIQGYARESSSHLACASTVAKGGAELGCGCERGIERVAGVEFVPLQMEWYDFVFRLVDRNTPAIRTISSYISSDEFKRDLEIMGGYELSQTGRYEEF
ncbi:helix-turn-helix transcriptional regulator [Treponema primitia]|uniref:helix-turn-helix transcriptional regulator n=1 Tax=Treponema primitia TaxID=88058 RepID=UPI00025557CF|nr:helix-turn-helix transcriptional regulator [Treponema primitia]